VFYGFAAAAAATVVLVNRINMKFQFVCVMGERESFARNGKKLAERIMIVCDRKEVGPCTFESKFFFEEKIFQKSHRLKSPVKTVCQLRKSQTISFLGRCPNTTEYFFPPNEGLGCAHLIEETKLL
jgi:hypothetical protein